MFVVRGAQNANVNVSNESGNIINSRFLGRDKTGKRHINKGFLGKEKGGTNYYS